MRITRASGTASEAIGRPSLSSPPPTPAPSAPLDATLAPGAPRTSSSVGVGMLSDRSDRARPSPIATLLPPALPPLPPLMLPPPLALPPVEEDRLRGAGPRSSSVWKMSTDANSTSRRHYYNYYYYYYYYNHYLLLPSVGASSHGCSGHDRADGRWAKGRGADRVLDGWGALAGRDRAPRASSKGR
uniref:Uncharacterized protein n=1 Tax=Anopheles coluzzii TaxID=1518534 RepID=A0A8W7PKY2_ANOCL